MSDISRRKFLAGAVAGGTSLALTAPGASQTAQSYSQIIGANERINIGIIGCGNRGRGAHMTGVNAHAKEENIEIIAVCDPYRLHRQQAAALTKKWTNREAQQYISHRELLARDDIDAVMIASCDHQHTTHLKDAAEAGKDIYVEKPLAMEMDRLNAAVDAVKAANVIVQVGTQLRSMASFTGCKALYESGIFGRVSRIEQIRNAERPYWYSYINKEVKKEDVEWGEFLMHRPWRPFDPVLFSGWYGYAEFSDGPLPGLGSHYIDLVHYITGAEFPTSCVCMGGVYTWKDENHFTCPDQIEAVWQYEEGFMSVYTTNFGNGFGNRFRLSGDAGVLKMDKWSEPVYTAEGGSKNKGTIRGENKVTEIPMPDHFLDWLQCIRSRQTPNASIDAGYQHAVACLMAMESYRSGRRTIFDKESRTINFG